MTGFDQLTAKFDETIAKLGRISDNVGGVCEAIVIAYAVVVITIVLLATFVF